MLTNKIMEFFRELSQREGGMSMSVVFPQLSKVTRSAMVGIFVAAGGIAFFAIPHSAYAQTEMSFIDISAEVSENGACGRAANGPQSARWTRSGGYRQVESPWEASGEGGFDCMKVAAFGDGTYLRDSDVRFGISTRDYGCGAGDAPQNTVWTNWASQGGGWSPAQYSNSDPDCVKLFIQVVSRPGYNLGPFRVGSERGDPPIYNGGLNCSWTGTQIFSPWTDNGSGGGWTGWGGGSDFYSEPGCGRIYLETKAAALPPPPVNPPTVTSVTISPNPVDANGVTTYTISADVRDLDGWSSISSVYAMINMQGVNATQYRGYIGWSTPAQNFPYWGGLQSGLISGGSGSCALYAGGNGNQYINVVGCGTSSSGDPLVRRVNFTVTFNTNFTTPTTNNTLSGWARDSTNLEHGWLPFGVFNLALPPTPDLIASTPTQNTATIGTPQTFTSTITNGGTAATGATFQNSLQVATGAGGSGAVSPLTASTPSPMSALTAGGSLPATASYTFTGAAGTRSVRFCADNNTSMVGTIVESNEGNNCSGWGDVVVSSVSAISVNLTANPVGPLTAPGATTLSWTTTGSPSSCDASGSWSGTKTASGGSELRSAIPASTQVFNITCSKVGTTDATGTVTVVVNPAAAPATVSISANQTTIPYNTSTTLNWSYSNATSCTITLPATIGSYPNGSGSISTGNLTTSRIYTISCDPSGANSTKNVTVNVLAQTFGLDVIKSGQGRVTGTPNPAQTNINCGGTCSATYTDGTTINLTATPNQSRIFTGWGGGCASFGRNPVCSLIMNSPKSVIANFIADPNYGEF